MLKENGAPPAEGKWADIAVLESRCVTTRRVMPPRFDLLTRWSMRSARIEAKRGAKAAAE